MDVFSLNRCCGAGSESASEDRLDSRADVYTCWASAGLSSVGGPTFMRALGSAPGMFAFECAMDELSVALRMDPIELRLKNYLAERLIRPRPPVEDDLKNALLHSEGLRSGRFLFGGL